MLLLRITSKKLAVSNYIIKYKRMDDFREWVITYILDELEMLNDLKPTYKYTNMECWDDYVYKKIAYQNLVDEIKNDTEKDPLDIIAYEMDRMLRYGYKASSDNAKTMFMTAYYLYEYILTIFSEVEWSVEIVEGD